MLPRPEKVNFNNVLAQSKTCHINYAHHFHLLSINNLLKAVIKIELAKRLATKNSYFFIVQFAYFFLDRVYKLNLTKGKTH